ncbi:Reverse transcriptase-RNase H-integrase [Phytophthora megakarya]|uniref:Reverse transcriptase-RNase H-integrase n=1 Tax=Phytophthora megakarya TaxID=4795 RepID=A0A225WBY0_9STRA|nr:Reverse transcriptase-RNase H-integrase [Phytophthora megakarya]
MIDRPFFINIDHRTIEDTQQQQTCSQRLARRLNELALFQPQFRWVAGNTNVVADTISRNPTWNDGNNRAVSLAALLESLTSMEPADEGALFAQTTQTSVNITAECIHCYNSDKHWSYMAHTLQPRKFQRYELLNGLLYFRIRPGAPARVCVPANISTEKHCVARGARRANSRTSWISQEPAPSSI